MCRENTFKTEVYYPCLLLYNLTKTAKMFGLHASLNFSRMQLTSFVYVTVRFMFQNRLYSSEGTKQHGKERALYVSNEALILRLKDECSRS
jgi:hypothetical protein